MGQNQQCTSEPIKISIKEVVDFCWCPQYHKIKYNNPNEKNFKELYDIALHKCFYYYLGALQNNDPASCSITTLKKKWGKEWIKQKTNSEIICTPSAQKRDTYDSNRKSGIDAIITFDELMNEKQFPIILNKPYEIKITENIILTGTWEYVREIERNGKNIIQVMKFKTEYNKFQVNHQIEHDLELTAAAYAFSNQFNVDSFELVYVDIYKKKLIVTSRYDKDFKLLKNTVISTVQSLKHNIKCISPDKKCYHCEYRNVCVSYMKGE